MNGGGWLRWVRLVGILAAMVGIGFVVPLESDPVGGMALRVIGTIVVLVLLAWGVFRQIRLSLTDTDRRVDGLVVAIVAVLVVFSISFSVLQAHDPTQFEGLETRLDSVYFAATTMLTIGYGDIHATGQAARALVLVQMVFDILFVAAAAGLLSERLRTRAASRGHHEHGPTGDPKHSSDTSPDSAGRPQS